MAVREKPPLSGKGAWFIQFLADCANSPGEWMRHEEPVSPGKANEIKGGTNAHVLAHPGQWEAEERKVDAAGIEAAREGAKVSVWLYAKFTPAPDGSRGEDGAAGAV